MRKFIVCDHALNSYYSTGSLSIDITKRNLTLIATGPYVTDLLSFTKNFRPALRQYLLDGEFFVGAAISCTLTKLALRFLDMEKEQEKQNVCNSKSGFWYCLQKFK